MSDDIAATIQPGVYRHYKGGLYDVLGVVRDSTNGPNEGRWLVLYFSREKKVEHVREVFQFVEMVEWPDGDSRSRFEWAFEASLFDNLIAADLAWLERLPRSHEREHIKRIVQGFGEDIHMTNGHAVRLAIEALEKYLPLIEGRVSAPHGLSSRDAHAALEALRGTSANNGGTGGAL